MICRLLEKQQMRIEINIKIIKKMTSTSGNQKEVLVDRISGFNVVAGEVNVSTMDATVVCSVPFLLHDPIKKRIMIIILTEYELEKKSHK